MLIFNGKKLLPQKVYKEENGTPYTFTCHSCVGAIPIHALLQFLHVPPKPAILKKKKCKMKRSLGKIHYSITCLKHHGECILHGKIKFLALVIKAFHYPPFLTPSLPPSVPASLPHFMRIKPEAS